MRKFLEEANIFLLLITWIAFLKIGSFESLNKDLNNFGFYDYLFLVILFVLVYSTARKMIENQR